MPPSASILLQERLRQALLESVGSEEDVRFRLHDGNSDLMDALVQTLENCFRDTVRTLLQDLPPEKADEIHHNTKDPLFCRRVKEQVLEDLYGERTSPPLHIYAGLLDATDSRHPLAFHPDQEEIPIHAVCVECLPNFGNELYPLMVDSYVCDLAAHWRQRRCVMGVHLDWLNKDLQATRCIYAFPERDKLMEASLEQPLSFDSVHFLAMSPESHRQWSERFSSPEVMQINPYEMSRLADDKYACYESWRSYDIPTPQAVLIQRDEIQHSTSLPSRVEKAWKQLFAQASADKTLFIIQPNQGTEGRGTQAYTGAGDWSNVLSRHPHLLEHVHQVAQSDDVLFRRGIADVKMQHPGTGEKVFFDLRVNLAWGRMESGFLLLAPPGQVIASPGQGGQVLEWKEGIETQPLFCTSTGESLTWNQKVWHDIQRVAEGAVACIPRCRMVGVDIRLIQNSGSIQPVVLDINPRPAGFAHSRYFDTHEPGVSQLMWDQLPSRHR